MYFNGEGRETLQLNLHNVCKSADRCIWKIAIVTCNIIGNHTEHVNKYSIKNVSTSYFLYHTSFIYFKGDVADCQAVLMVF